MAKVSFSHNECVSTQWASVLLQPIPGTDERIVVAIAAVNERGETRCLRTIEPATVKAVFGDERRYVTDLLAIATSSLDAHLAHKGCLYDWQPPVEGIGLGTCHQSKSADIDELASRAASLSTIFYTGNTQPQPAVPKRRRWMDEVATILEKRSTRLRNHLDIPVPLGDHDAPATFSFLDSHFAANLVTFSKRDLPRRVEEARAGLWSLSLLADAPYIFRPVRKELLAGIDLPAPDGSVQEAIDEITDEASRRNVLVTALDSPESVVEHIIQYAAV